MARFNPGDRVVVKSGPSEGYLGFEHTVVSDNGTSVSTTPSREAFYGCGDHGAHEPYSPGSWSFKRPMWVLELLDDEADYVEDMS